MLTQLGEKMELNKMESLILLGLVLIFVLFATAHIVFIANKLGIHLSNHKVTKILDYVSAGGDLSTAFAVIAGITLPAWVVTAAAALGATAA